MRLLRVGVLSALVAVAASLAAGAAARVQGAARVDCGTKTLTFLFWPNGHDAIPSINFPSYPYPHMEVYKTKAGAFPDPNELALIEFLSNGQVAGGFAKSCARTRSRIINSRPATAKTNQATSLVCKLPKVAQLDYQKYTGTIAVGLTATLRSSSHTAPLEVQAYLTGGGGGTGGGSFLRYDPKHCKAFPPPH